MRVLVTGSAGFIGSHLVNRLAERGDEIVALDDLSTGQLGNITDYLGRSNFKFVKGDIRDKKLVRDCASRVDSVVHLAAISSVPYSVQNPLETHQVNVTGTLNLLEACVNDGVEKFIYASSCAVYGDAKKLPISEDHPLDARSPYAESKIAAEEYCHVFRKRYKLQTVSVRAFNVYGPGQRKSDYGGVLTRFVGRMENGEPPIIYGDGEQSRDFVHVYDIVTALIRILEDKGQSSEVYNLGSGRAVTINQLASILQQTLHREDLKPIHMPPRAGDIKQSQADISRAQSELGFRPHISLEEGLRRLVTSQAKSLAVKNCALNLPVWRWKNEPSSVKK